MRVHNFSPGPAMLPFSVLEEAGATILEYENLGMSLAEMSHRTPKIMQVVEEAMALIKTLLNLNDDFEVIWLPGGASSQLVVAPMNLISAKQTAAFVNTGFWAEKSIAAAAQVSKAHVLASSKDQKYSYIPKDWTLPKTAQYLHVVSNETIDGTQYHTYPDVKIPLVADMTSDFLTRPLPTEKFGIIFASAQKNFGIAGITCVVIRKDMLERKVKRVIPTIFDYKTHVANQSLYHTAPTFPIYVAMLMLRWIKAQGGVKVMEQRNIEKSTLLYDEIDRNPLFRGSVVKEDRSVLNVCFTITQPTLEKAFLDFVEQHQVVGIKGFPTVGGFRASMYNGLPKESVAYLAELMQAFSAQYI